jgi:hypothetical protein
METFSTALGVLLSLLSVGGAFESFSDVGLLPKLIVTLIAAGLVVFSLAVRLARYGHPIGRGFGSSELGRSIGRFVLCSLGTSTRCGWTKLSICKLGVGESNPIVKAVSGGMFSWLRLCQSQILSFLVGSSIVTLWTMPSGAIRRVADLFASDVSCICSVNRSVKNSASPTNNAQITKSPLLMWLWSA